MKTHTPIITVTLTVALLAMSSAASARCTDSDTAGDPAAVGRVVDNSGATYFDSCSSNRLVQVSCDASGNVAYSAATICPSGRTCVGGVCQVEVVTTPPQAPATTSSDPAPTASEQQAARDATAAANATTYSSTIPNTTTFSTTTSDTSITVTAPTIELTTQPATTTVRPTTTDTTITTDVRPTITDERPTTELPDCILRARRVCGSLMRTQATEQNILLRSDVQLQTDLTQDLKTAISLEDPVVLETRTLVAEDPTTAMLTALDGQDTDRSRLALCIRRVAQICENPDAYRQVVTDECSDRRFAAENPTRCPLQPVRQAECVGTNTPITSTSAIFGVADAKVLNFPIELTSQQIHTPLLLVSPADPLAQYVLIPRDAPDGTLELLGVDPKTGMARIFNLPANGKELYVVNATAGPTLVMVSPNQILYFPNAWARVEEGMKGAGSIDQLFTTPPSDWVNGWAAAALPADTNILSSSPTDTGIIVVTANANSTLKGFLHFVSISDANGKTISAPASVAASTLRKSIITMDNGKLSANLALMTNTDNGAKLSILQSPDLLAEPPTFVMLIDNDPIIKEFEKAKSKKVVKQSEVIKNSKKETAGKKGYGAKNSDTDNAKFKELMVEALSSQTVGEPVVSHAFEDFGDRIGSLVKQEGELGFFKLDNGALAQKKDEHLALGVNGTGCGEVIAGLPVDINNWGGKDLVLFMNNGGALSMVTYPNINQVQKFEMVTAAITDNDVHLNAKTLWEESEPENCHWEAHQKMPDGTLKDVSSQLVNANSCEATFKLEAPQTSLMEKPSALDVALNWLIAQISISAAYADEVSATTTTDYVFRITTTDPLGLTATAQVNAQIATPTAAKGVQTPVTADTGSTTTTKAPEIKITSVELLTPTQKEDVKVLGGTTPQGGGSTPGMGAQAITPPVVISPEGVGGPAEAPHGFAAEGGCSLARHTTTPSQLGWLWLLPLLAFIPARAICCQRSPRRPNRCRSARGRRR